MEKRYKEIDGVRYQVIQNTILGSNVIPVGESLPEVTTSDNGKLLGVSSGEWTPVDAPSGLPDITGNAGKVLKVNAGATGTEWANETIELPAVTADDEGDVLTVNSSGEWEAAAPGGGGGGAVYYPLISNTHIEASYNDIKADLTAGKSVYIIQNQYMPDMAAYYMLTMEYQGGISGGYAFDFIGYDTNTSVIMVLSLGSVTADGYLYKPTNQGG